MPTYDFTCHCGTTEIRHVVYEERNKPRLCIECGHEMKREFPCPTVDIFESYYDEGLGCDVTGKEDRKHKMKILNVHEAGDKVGGARNFDEHAPHHVKPLPPRGAALDARGPVQDFDVAVENNGEVTSVVNTADLETV